MNKFIEVEEEAIRLLRRVLERNITYDEIDTGFMAIKNKMYNFIEDDNTLALSQGAPYWLVEFISFCFIDWHRWYLLRKLYTEHPERFDAKLRGQYAKLEQRGYDDIFLNDCDTCLRKLSQGM